MPSKRRMRLEKMRQRYTDNAELVLSASQIRYLSQKETLILRAKERYANNTTTRKHTGKCARDKLQNDTDCQNRNRARALVNTRRRLEIDEAYRNKNRERALISTKKRLEIDEEYKNRNRLRSIVNAKNRDTTKVNSQRKLGYINDENHRRQKLVKAHVRHSQLKDDLQYKRKKTSTSIIKISSGKKYDELQGTSHYERTLRTYGLL